MPTLRQGPMSEPARAQHFDAPEQLRGVIEGGCGDVVDTAPPDDIAWTGGVASVLPSGAHALMMDLDGVRSSLVLLVRLRRLQMRHALPALHLWESSPGHYHAMALCARPADEIAAIMRDAGSDVDHRDAGLIQGYWVLRTEDRPGRERRYVGAMPSERPSECEATDLWRLAYAGERGSADAA